MSYWQLANEVEQISFRLDSIKSIIEMVAERVIENPESSALWGCAEMLEVYSEKLEKLTGDAMELHKAEKVKEPKKGKKK
jgi:hypothetical protein